PATTRPIRCGASSATKCVPAPPTSVPSPAAPALGKDQMAAPPPPASPPSSVPAALLPPIHSNPPPVLQSAVPARSPAPAPHPSPQNASADSRAAPRSSESPAPKLPGLTPLPVVTHPACCI